MLALVFLTTNDLRVPGEFRPFVCFHVFSVDWVFIASGGWHQCVAAFVVQFPLARGGVACLLHKSQLFFPRPLNCLPAFSLFLGCKLFRALLQFRNVVAVVGFVRVVLCCVVPQEGIERGFRYPARRTLPEKEQRLHDVLTYRLYALRFLL